MTGDSRLSDAKLKSFARQMDDELFLAESCLQQLKLIANNPDPFSESLHLDRILREASRLENTIPSYRAMVAVWFREATTRKQRLELERVAGQMNRLIVVGGTILRESAEMIMHLDRSANEVDAVLKKLMK